KVGVMRRDDAVSLPFIKFFKENLRQCTTQFRVGTCTEFINQRQSILITFSQKITHVFESIAVSTQTIFNRLIITNICQNFVKQKRGAPLVNRNKNTAL